MGMIFNFFSTGGLVFSNLKLAIVPRFISCYAVMFFLYWFLIRGLAPIVGGRLGAMLVIVAPMSLATYFLQARFVFRAPRGGVEDLAT